MAAMVHVEQRRLLGAKHAIESAQDAHDSFPVAGTRHGAHACVILDLCQHTGQRTPAAATLIALAFTPVATVAVDRALDSMHIIYTYT